jgi:hypothetical protein
MLLNFPLEVTLQDALIFGLPSIIYIFFSLFDLLRGFAGLSIVWLLAGEVSRGPQSGQHGILPQCHMCYYYNNFAQTSQL